MQLVREISKGNASINGSYSFRPHEKTLARFSSNAMFYIKSFRLTRTCTTNVWMTRYDVATQWTGTSLCEHFCERGSFMELLLAGIFPIVQPRFGSHSTRLAPSFWTKLPTSSKKRCPTSIASTTDLFVRSRKGVGYWMHLQILCVEGRICIDLSPPN